MREAGIRQSVPSSETARPTLLVCATMWWPLSARLAIALVRHQSRVVAICPPGHPLRFVSGIEHVHPYRSIDSLGSLKTAILESSPDLIIPCDDGVVWQLHRLYETSQEFRPLIERSLGSNDAFTTIESRGAVLQTAENLGIRIPRTVAIHSEKELEAWRFEGAAVLKLDGTWGGSGVSIVGSKAAALAEFRRMAKPPGAGFAFKRWVINRDPLALWFWRRKLAPNITIQDFVAGRPANTMIACWQGEVLGIVTVEVLASQGATGAATVIHILRNEEIERAARLLAEKFQLNGFHGLDFMLEEETGAAYLIELNPRSTQLGHLRLSPQGDLAGMLLDKLTGHSAGEPVDCIEGDVVAFFPQTLNWNPKSAYLRRGYHDVPWEEPALFRELLLQDWPQRQWISRIYHVFRAPQQTHGAQFEQQKN